jgi:DNA repair exonuclease SbcCD nuclease subunit
MSTLKLLALADLHLRELKPECRDAAEDWLVTIDNTIQFIATLAQEKRVNDIIIAGDVFDSWRTNSMEFLIQCSLWLKSLDKQCREIGGINYVGRLVCIPGNHDSMGGNLDELKRSPYTLMANMGVFRHLTKQQGLYYPVYYSDDLHDGTVKHNGRPIIVMHKGMYYKHKPFDEVKEENNIEWFVENCTSENTRLIISGDYHKPFTQVINGITCVNCGSVFRLRADQIDYKPKITYIEYSMTDNKVIKVEDYPIPLSYDIHREHIDEKKELYKKLSDMLDTVDDSFEMSLNFKDNFKHFICNDQYRDTLLALFDKMYDYK